MLGQAYDERGREGRAFAAMSGVPAMIAL